MHCRLLGHSTLNSLTQTDILLLIIHVTLSFWLLHLDYICRCQFSEYGGVILSHFLHGGINSSLIFLQIMPRSAPRSVTSSKTRIAAAAVMAINCDFGSTGLFSSTFVNTKCFHIFGIVFVSFVNEVLKFSFA